MDGSLPAKDEIFVFGSNEAGFHGAGAAALAYVDYGALMFKAYGHMGNSFGIPTKRKKYSHRLSLTEIQVYVDRFVAYTRRRHNLKFFVTSVGCGYSRYEPKDIAPMFRKAINCNFPDQWSQYLSDLPIEKLPNISEVSDDQRESVEDDCSDIGDSGCDSKFAVQEA